MLHLEDGWCSVIPGSCSTSGFKLLLCHQSVKAKSFYVYLTVCYVCTCFSDCLHYWSFNES